MMMLPKADVWIHQFRFRLNLGIVALVLLWGAVSYFQSTGMQFAARAMPESDRILLEGSLSESGAIPTVDVNSLEREMAVETVESVEIVETEEAQTSLPVNAAQAAPTEILNKDLAQNISSSETSGPGPKKKTVTSKRTP
jgi:hypothetical protein